MSINLHIGLAKTGTTYIQKNFYNVSKEISKDIHYPDIGFYNHQLALYDPFGDFIPWNTKGKGRNSKWTMLLDEMIDSTKKNRNSLISSEALSAMNREGVKNLSKVLVNNNIKLNSIIITTRPMEKLLPSHWQQRLKTGGTVSLENHLNKIMDIVESSTEFSHIYSYYDTVKIWKEFFNNVTFNILFMNGKHKQNLRKFSEIVGLTENSIKLVENNKLPASEHNSSLTINECSKLIEINKKIKNGKLNESHRQRMLQSFFNSKKEGEVYEKPESNEEIKLRAKLLDVSMKKNIKKCDNCFLYNGNNVSTGTQK